MPSASRIESQLRGHPDAPALTYGETRWTAKELERAARTHCAKLLERGARRGDVVAVLLNSTPDLVVAYLANLLAGFVHLPINTAYHAQEIAYLLEDSSAKWVITSSAYTNRITQKSACVQVVDIEQSRGRHHVEAQLPPPPMDAPALLMYTSGTTGRSKGVVHSLASVEAGIGALTDLWKFSPNDRLVLSLPLFHVHGLAIGVHGSLMQGVEIDLRGHFGPRDVVEAIEDGGTIFMGVPTMYARMLEHLEQDPAAADSLRKARLFTSGSAALPARHHQRFEELTGHRILERYGMTETMLTISNPYEAERRPGSIGMPVGDTEIRIVNDSGDPVPPDTPGELLVKGSSIMKGYLNRPEANEKSFDGDWFRTGDMVRRSADGYVTHMGRMRADFLKSGGYRISAREIEDVLHKHSLVREVAVVGTPDEVWGEVVTAAVVPSDWVQAGVVRLRDVLIELGKEELADFKRPRRIILLDSIPRNALGKTQKHILTEQLSTFDESIGETSVSKILGLRHRELRVGRPFESAHFSCDEVEGVRHFALSHDGEPVVCLSMTPAQWRGQSAWQLRGMATDSRVQGHGLGRRLLSSVVAMLHRDTPRRVFWCNARTHAIGFYEKQGWSVVSDEFDIPLVGPHRRMLLDPGEV